jgi:hypothetical protein
VETQNHQRKDEHTPEEFYDRAGFAEFGKMCVFLWGILSAKRYPKLQGYLLERKLKF